MKGAVRGLLDAAVRPYGYMVTDASSLYEWQRRSPLPILSSGRTDPLLVEDHPRLVTLAERYARFDCAVTTPALWTSDHIGGARLRYFRGIDAPYVWQLRGPNMNILGYALTTYYVRSIDSLALMSRFTDDDWFGNHTLTIDRAVVSRDLLDSVIELYFLERHLNLSAMRNVVMLDVGAGYGRLAHRTCEAMPNVAKYLCVDAVAQSTFISEFYLNFRRSRASVVALDEIEAALDRTRPDIAVNIHSFSECRLEAIDWWLRRLSRAGVRHLMIVPNDPNHDGGQSLLNNDRQDFGPLLAQHGYKLIAKEPKYLDPTVQQYAINPAHHYLFELA